VTISRFWLLLLAALVLAAPLAAEEIDAPQPRWQDAAPAQNTQQSSAEKPAQDASTSAPQTAAEKSQQEKAEEQIREQEHQRVLGVVPSFNVSYRSDAVSLTGGQKIRLAFHTTVDPVTFVAATLVAGYHEALNDQSGFPWGPKGYGERVGTAYLDSFSSTMIGNGILPAILHQDPRYFRLGHGSTTHRLLYATATAFVCKHDNTGKWEPNYSNIGGNIISGALSNLYYPNSNSGAGLTVTNGMVVTAEGAFGSIFQEFWPDISRKLFHKDPTHGHDAVQSSASAPEGKSQN
jgi:hypothetical protein